MPGLRRSSVWKRCGGFVSILWVAAMPSFAAIRYVDSSVATSGNGQSWSTAWKTVSNITGIAAGDTIYFSGGPTGSSQTYAISGSMPLVGGSSGAPTIYAVGQDSAHNGTVVFTSSSAWIYNPPNWVTINGEVNGARHMQVASSGGGSETVVAQGKTGIVIRGVIFPHQDSINANGTDRSWEIANNELWCTYDHVMSVNGPASVSAFAQSILFHDNTLYMQQESSTGIGCDGIQNINGSDIYNNQFIAVNIGCNSCFPSGQHQDGIQTDGAYQRIYNNTFSDIANYPVFYELFGSSSGPVYIYNNVIQYTDNRHNGGAQQGVAIGNSGGVNNAQWSNFVVANNTAINIGYPGSGGNCYTMRSASGTGNGFTGTNYFYNNLCYGTTGGNIIASGITQGNNVVTSTGGTSIFAAYATPTSTPFALDAHLKSTATGEIGQGSATAVSSFFKTDKDGNARGSSWDIGAYQYSTSTTSTPPPPPPVTLAAPTGLTAVAQ